MNKADLKEIDKTCEYFHKIIVDCIDLELHRIIKDYNFDKKFMESLKKNNFQSFNLPEKWFGYNIMQYTAGKVFGKNGRQNKYLGNDYTAKLRDEEKEVLNFFKNDRWFYSVFSIDSSLSNDYHYVINHINNEKLLLKSESVSNLKRKGANLFFSLFFYNGKCYQTYGTIHHYKSILPSDFEYFVKLFHKDYKAGNDYSLIIENNPVLFYLLDISSNIPTIVSRDNEIGMYGSIWECDPIDPNEFVNECIIDKIKNIYQFSIKEWDIPPHFAKFYFNENTSEMFLHASTLKGYKKIIDVLNKVFDLDYEPEWQVSMNAYVSIERITNRIFPSLRYAKAFGLKELEEEKKDQNKDSKLTVINNMIREMTDAYNNGLNYNLEELADKYGISIEDAKNVEKLINRKSPIDDFIKKDEGLKGFTPPPPIKRHVFSSPFTHSDFFDFNLNTKSISLIENTINESKEMDETDDDLSIKNYQKAIMGKYEEIWQTSEQTVLQYTVYLLLKNGGDFHLATDYSKEFLKTFGHLYIKNKKDLNNFIKDYLDFLLLDIFLFYNLIEIEYVAVKSKHKNFKIRSSELFKSWIKLKKDF